MRFKRPPRSSKEAISTLKEADKRYEINKQSLIGRNRAFMNHDDIEKQRQKREGRK